MDNETEIVFQLFEKEKLLVEKDTALQVVQGDKEVTEITAKVKDGYAVAEVLLRPKADTDFKTWRNLLKFDKKPSERKETYIWIKVENKDFYKGEEIKIISSNWYEPVENPISTNYTQSGTEVTSYSKHWGLFGNTRNGGKHAGLDLFAKTGENIIACLDGIVVNRRWHGGYGNTVTIKVKDPSAMVAMKREYDLQYPTEGEKEKDTGFSENGNLYLFYAHLDSVKDFKYGQEVKAGDKLGETGRSGVTDGTRAPHLHFEIKSSKSLGNRINPAFFVNYKVYDNQTENEKDLQKKEMERGKIKEVNGTKKLEASNMSN